MSEKKHNAESKTHREKNNKIGLIDWLRSRLITGLVIATPIVVPVFVIVLVVGWIDERVKPIVQSAIPPQVRDSRFYGVPVDTLIDAIPGLGVLFAIIALILLGAFAANFVGRKIIQTGERLAERVPIVSTLYTPLRQLVEIFSDNSSSSFKEVVMVEYPKKGTWAVGFVTSRARGQISDQIGDDFIGVFVPTTPNPTSGFLMFIPENEVRKLDMTVEDGAKLIVSAGVVMPKEPENDKQIDLI